EIERVAYLPFLAAVYGRMGRGEEGLAMLAEALAFVTGAGMRVVEARLYVAKGEVLLAGSGDYSEEAEGCFRQAIEINLQQQAKWLELGAGMSLARLWQQHALEHGAGSTKQSAGRKKQGARNTQHVIRNKLKEAHQMLSDIYNWFTEGFGTKDLQEAK